MPFPEGAIRALSRLLIGACVAGLAGCGGAGEPAGAPVRPLPPPPDERLVTDPAPEPLPELPAAVSATRDAILEAAEARSLRRLARLADAQPAFLSNLGNVDHYEHWYLMRATGFDVPRELEALFAEPYGVRRVGQETWFVWPDLATLQGGPLVLERLSFRDRARLKTLIGETGIEALRAGEPYPGIRTAIAEDGGWRYFLHENGLKEDTEHD